MKAREIMVQPVVVVREDTTLEEIARLMLDRRIGCVPVVDDEGKLTGIVTESDFTGKERGLPFSAYRAPKLFGRWVPREGVERIYEAARTMTARDIMSAPVITAEEDDSLTEVVERLIEYDINRLPIVRDGAPVGLITRHDLLRVMTRHEERGQGHH